MNRKKNNYTFVTLFLILRLTELLLRTIRVIVFRTADLSFLLWYLLICGFIDLLIY